MSAPLRPAVFLDRDGTLNTEVNYLYRPEDLLWIEGAPEAVARLNAAGVAVVVITNQAGVARGFYTEEDVQALHQHMQRELHRAGAHVDAFYYSPFHPEATVDAYRRVSPCRKPGDALYRKAIADLGIDAQRSFAVGDRVSDLTPAMGLGCRAFLVETGHGRSEIPLLPPGAQVASSIVEAVDLLLRTS